MPKVSELVDGALRRIGVTPLEQPSIAAHAATGVDLFNGMMFELQEGHWIDNYTALKAEDEVSFGSMDYVDRQNFNQARTAVVPVPAFYESAKSALGVRAAQEFPTAHISRSLLRERRRFFNMMQERRNKLSLPQRFERGLWEPRPGGYRYQWGGP